MSFERTANIPFHENDAAEVIVADKGLDVFTDFMAVEAKDEVLVGIIR